MANTKKEHYVPRCYLKNFASQSDDRIHVFDKQKMQIRTNQPIIDVAMENRFYDLSLYDIYKSQEVDKRKKIEADLESLFEFGDIESNLKSIDEEQHVEKVFFSNLESTYGQLLKVIINNSYNGNQWVIDKCFAFSESNKELLSLFIAIQIIRTKSFRDTIGAIIEKLFQTMAYKSQMNESDALPKELFAVEANDVFVKLQHNGMILNPEVAIEFAKVLLGHTWIMYVNKTSSPFYTSDDPVVNIPHKANEFISYGGFNSEGIEILFPISPYLLLGMYDTNRYGGIFSDRKFMRLVSSEDIEYFNRAQVIHSQRFLFSSSDNFDLAKKVCTEHPELQHYEPHIEVS